MPNDSSLRGRIILVVEGMWMIATALAIAFEAKGAQAVLVKHSHPDLANVPNLAPHSSSLTQVGPGPEVRGLQVGSIPLIRLVSV